jgi:hypothetical protein
MKCGNFACGREFTPEVVELGDKQIPVAYCPKCLEAKKKEIADWPRGAGPKFRKPKAT